MAPEVAPQVPSSDEDSSIEDMDVRNPDYFSSSDEELEGHVSPFGEGIDLSFELMKYFVSCNQGAGSSDKDIQAVLDLIQCAVKHDIGLETLEYKTLNEYKAYISRSLEELDDGWKMASITIPAGTYHGQTVDYTQQFHYRDPVDWLATEWQSKDNKDAFTVDAGIAFNSQNERLYNEPHQCDMWITLQNDLRQYLDPNGVIAALQFYSDKTVVNKKGLSCHPIRAALLNVRHSTRVRQLDNVGYFPTMSHPAGMNDRVWRLVKLRFISEAMNTLLSPLKALSYEGIILKEPNEGEEVKVYPRLLSYVMDDPEVKDLTAVKGQGSPYPCEACWVHKDDLLQIETRAPIRTEKQQEVIWNANSATMSGLPEPGEVNDFLRPKITAVHPVPSGLWGFAQQQDGLGNSMLSMGFESMHNMDLGVSLYTIDNMREYLIQEKGKSSVAAQKILTELNKRMKKLPRAGKYTFSKIFTLYFYICSFYRGLSVAIQQRGIL
jgi:hypothetical protein